MVNIIQQLDFTASLTIKLHIIAVSMNIHLRKLGIDPIDEYSDEDLIRLGIRKYTFSTDTNYNVMLNRDEMLPDVYDTIILGSRLPISKPVSTSESDYSLLSWRYYKHLMGEYHAADYIILDKFKYLVDYESYGYNSIVIRSIDDDSLIELTKANMAIHTVTHRELLKMGEYFNNVVKKYSGFEILIRGIIRPTLDVNRLLHSPSGTILEYETSMIGNNELDLIPNISYELIRHLARWNVEEYTLTDDLYSAGIYITLIQQAFYAIHNFRLEAIGTNQVSDFNANMLFASTLNVYEESTVLIPYSRMWLYKNIKYIMNNIGKQEVLDKIVEHIIKPSRFTLNRLILKGVNPSTNPLSIVDSKVLQYLPYNKDLYITDYSERYDDIKPKTIKNIEINQLANRPSKHYYINDQIMIDERDTLLRPNSSLEDSNTMILEAKNNVTIHMSEELNIYMDHLVSYLHSDKLYNKHISIKSNGITSDVDMTIKDALYLALYFVLKHNGKEDERVTHYVPNTIYRTGIIDDSIYDNLMLSDTYKNKFTNIIKYRPSPTLASTFNFFVEELDNRKTWDFTTRGVISTVPYYIGQKYSTVLDRLKDNTPIKLDINTDTLNEYINSNFIIAEKDDYSYLYTAIDIFETIIGKVFYTERVNINIVRLYKSLVNKLTSYTTNIVTNDVGLNITSFTRMPGAIYGLNLSHIYKGHFKCYESFNGIHEARISDEAHTLYMTKSRVDAWEFIDTELEHKLDIDNNDLVIGNNNMVMEIL